MQFKPVSILAASIVVILAAGCGVSPTSTADLPLTSATSSTTFSGIPTTLSGSPTTTVRAATTTRPPVTARWEPITSNLAGLTSECGNLSLLSVRPDRDMVTVSVAQRGLWAMENGSETWAPLGQGAGSATITNRGVAIVYDPQRPNTFWESGSYNGGGVYRTDDNGRTFRRLGSVVHSDAVSVDFTDPERRTLLSGTHEQTVLYLSRDGGATWSDIARPLARDVGFTSQPLVLDSQTYLIGTSDAPNSGVFRTADGGISWKPVYKGSVKGPPLVAKSDGAIYWVTGAGGIIKSVDNGMNWVDLAAAGFIHWTAPYLAELPDGAIAAVGQLVNISADHGATWRTIGPSLPYRPTGFAYSAFRNAFYIWYFACDFSTQNPIAADQILRLDFDYKTQ